MKASRRKVLILSILEFTDAYELVQEALPAIRELGNAFCEAEANSHGVDVPVLDFYLFPSFPIYVLDVDIDVGLGREEPESCAILPPDDRVLEEEGFGVEGNPLLRGNVVVEEGVEEAAEEHEDGKCPIPHVGAVACKAHDDEEEHDVPAHSPVVRGVGRGAPAEECSWWCW